MFLILLKTPLTCRAAVHFCLTHDSRQGRVANVLRLRSRSSGQVRAMTVYFSRKAGAGRRREAARRRAQTCRGKARAKDDAEAKGVAKA
eukprot:905287-Pleurochrysis_carterae.AAC.3